MKGWMSAGMVLAVLLAFLPVREGWGAECATCHQARGVEERVADLDPIRIRTDEGIRSITLGEAYRFHGHSCPGLILTFRAAQHGIRLLFGEEVPDRKDLEILTRASLAGGFDLLDLLMIGEGRKAPTRPPAGMARDRDLIAFTFIRKSTRTAVDVRMKPEHYPEDFFAYKKKQADSTLTPAEWEVLHGYIKGMILDFPTLSLQRLFGEPRPYPLLAWGGALPAHERAAPPAPEYGQIVVATGSPYELGLVDELAREFSARHGGAVRCIKTPTGPGLDLGRNGLAHITIGHEEEATARFAAEGHAARRDDLMHNYTVIVGPLGDPAGIDGARDLGEAHRRIFRAGAPYLSRGDGGGMDLLERKTWESLGLDPAGSGWYATSGRFMLDSLLDADARGQYHMLDSSTWAMHKAKTKNLRLLVLGPPNRYEICLVSAKKHPHLSYNGELAEAFYEFLTGEEGQRVIARFGVGQYGEPLYHPARSGAGGEAEGASGQKN